MSDDSPTIDSSELLDRAEQVPQIALSTVLGNIRVENERRIKAGEPIVSPLTEEEASVLQYGAQLGAELLLNILHELASGETETAAILAEPDTVAAIEEAQAEEDE